MEKGNLPNDTPASCLLPPAQPLPRIFPIENFLRSIFTIRVQTQSWRLVACLETGEVARVTGAWIRGSRGSKMPKLFQRTCTLQTPCPLCLLKFWISASRGRINNISKCRLWTRQGMARWQQKRGNWFVGWFKLKAAYWSTYTQSLSSRQNHVVTHLCFIWKAVFNFWFALHFYLASLQYFHY